MDVQFQSKKTLVSKTPDIHHLNHSQTGVICISLVKFNYPVDLRSNICGVAQ